MSKELKTRIQHKIDTAEKWNESTIVPLEGELIIYSNGNSTANLEGIDPNIKAPAFKIGDGSHKVGELPFATLGIELDPDDPEEDDPIIPDPEEPNSVNMPTIVSSNYTYTGNKITPKWDHSLSSDYFTYTGDTEAINAGTYSVTFTLIDKTNTRWSNGTTDDYTVTWQIQKATYTLQVANNELTFESIDSVAPANQQVIVKTMANVDALRILYSAAPDERRVTVENRTKSGPDAEGFYSYTYDLSCTSFVTDSTETIDFDIYNETNYNNQYISITINCVAISTEDINDISTLSWTRIAEIVESGDIPEGWAVGNKKKLELTGSIKDVGVSNLDIYAQIIGIDYHLNEPGQFGVPSKRSIDFMIGVTEHNKPVALVDPHGYDGDGPGGNKYWVMNRYESTTQVGWNATYMRNSILGGASVKTIQTNSLMSCLPEELRTNLAPIRVTYVIKDDITASTCYDYLTLPSVGQLVLDGSDVNLEDIPSQESELYQNAKYPLHVNYSLNRWSIHRNDGETVVGGFPEGEEENGIDIPVNYWTRTINTSSPYQYIYLGYDPTVESNVNVFSKIQTHNYAISPIFRIGNVYTGEIDEEYIENTESEYSPGYTNLLVPSSCTNPNQIMNDLKSNTMSWTYPEVIRILLPYQPIGGNSQGDFTMTFGSYTYPGTIIDTSITVPDNLSNWGGITCMGYVPETGETDMYLLTIDPANLVPTNSTHSPSISNIRSQTTFSFYCRGVYSRRNDIVVTMNEDIPGTYD